MNQQQTIICTDIRNAVIKAVSKHDPEDIFILTDDNSLHYCFPLIKDTACLKGSHQINISAGDENKNIDSAVHVWKYLSEMGLHANR